MTRPINDPGYWKQRLQDAKHLHQSIYHCAPGLWAQIQKAHRECLARLIGPEDSIFDAGCGYGRLLSVMPPTWKGRYLGVDLSPDMLAVAENTWPSHTFRQVQLLDPPPDLLEMRFDWVVLGSMRAMVTMNLGQAAWDAIENNLLKMSNRLLFLEYDLDEVFSVVEYKEPEWYGTSD